MKVETVDEWEVHQRPEGTHAGTHYAVWSEGTRFETLVDVEDGKVTVETLRNASQAVVPLKVIMRLVELDKGK